MSEPKRRFVIVGVPGAIEPCERIEIELAATMRETIQMLRMGSADLLLAGLEIEPHGPWRLLKQVRCNWPKQRWALVADDQLSPADEIQARSLGATAIVDGPINAALLKSLADALLSRSANVESELALGATSGS